MLNIKEYILNKAGSDIYDPIDSSLFGAHIGNIEVTESNKYIKLYESLDVNPRCIKNLTEREVLQNLIEFGLQKAYPFDPVPDSAKVYLNTCFGRYSLEDELNKLDEQNSFIENYFD